MLFSQPVLLGAEKLSDIGALLGCVIAIRKTLPQLRHDLLAAICQIYFQALFYSYSFKLQLRDAGMAHLVLDYALLQAEGCGNVIVLLKHLPLSAVHT